MTKQISYSAIGTIFTPFDDLSGMPIQPTAAKGIRGKIELFPEFVDCLDDIELFSHIIILYHFHCSKGWKSHVTPFLDDIERGLFATRAPKRPNAIGLSIVRLIERKKNELIVMDVDILNGTPLLDVKPYIPAFDVRPDASSGWIKSHDDVIEKKVSDSRFVETEPDGAEK